MCLKSRLRFVPNPCTVQGIESQIGPCLFVFYYALTICRFDLCFAFGNRRALGKPSCTTSRIPNTRTYMTNGLQRYVLIGIDLWSCVKRNCDLEVSWLCTSRVFMSMVRCLQDYQYSNTVSRGCQLVKNQCLEEGIFMEAETRKLCRNGFLCHNMTRTCSRL